MNAPLPLSVVSTLASLSRRAASDERGNVAVIFGIAIIPLMVAVGAALDYSKALNVRTHMQAVLDSAVLAGAKESATDARLAKARAYFDSMQPGHFQTTADAKFSASNDGVVSGTSHAEVPTSLMAAFGFETIPVTVTAAAAAGAGGKVCILLLDQSSSQTLLGNSGAKLHAPDCEIHVKTARTPGIIINSGVNIEVKRACVKASTIINNGGTITNLERGCAAIDDPFAGKLPSVSLPAGSCKSANYNPDVPTVVLSGGNYCNVNFSNQSSVTLDPGMYGNMNFNQAKQVTLNPGVYIVKGGNWNVNSGTTFTGKDVTIYYADNSVIQFNSNVNVNLSAPTSGTYADILMYEASGLSRSNWAVNGTSGSTLTGLLYLPSKAVTINSVSNVTADKATMVFASLILNNTNWSVTPGAKAMSAGSGGGAVRLIN